MNNSDKKLGRRKAGSWGRTNKAGKRIANKATRKAAKPADLLELQNRGFENAIKDNGLMIAVDHFLRENGEL